MDQATAETYDVLLDGQHYYRLTTLAEWAAFQALSHYKGIQWRDADATRHRLLTTAAQGSLWPQEDTTV